MPQFILTKNIQCIDTLKYFFNQAKTYLKPVDEDIGKTIMNILILYRRLLSYHGLIYCLHHVAPYIQTAQFIIRSTIRVNTVG